MKISIIIPNYNGAELLAPCLESLMLQSYHEYDITVVDNGSSDHSRELLTNCKSNIQVVQLEDNLGFGKAVNIGIKATDGELILVLNNDTILDPECLTKIVSCVRAYPNYGVYAPRICEQSNPHKIYAAGLMFSDKGYGNRSQRYQLQSVDNPIDVFGACGAGAVYKRKVLNEVGLFNEEFFFLYEDQELSFRHQLLGYRCLYLPSAVIYHQGSATLRHYYPLVMKEAVKNSLITLITCTPKIILKKYIQQIVKFYLMFWYQVISRWYIKEYLHALAYVSVHISQIIKKRRVLQDNSIADIDYLDNLLYRGDIYINFPDRVEKL
jgi:hypothetical protein